MISTQVIEAGMDISCETMHVEVSPINSFYNVPGVARVGKASYGEIFVYDILELEEREKLEVKQTMRKKKNKKSHKQ